MLAAVFVAVLLLVGAVARVRWQTARLPSAEATASLEALLGTDRYIARSEFDAWAGHVRSTDPEGRRRFDKFFAQAAERLAASNASFVAAEVERLDHVLGRKLDLTRRQREAAVHNEDAHLVLSGAGAGKTHDLRMNPDRDTLAPLRHDSTSRSMTYSSIIPNGLPSDPKSVSRQSSLTPNSSPSH